jgi:hypothetical protein
MDEVRFEEGGTVVHMRKGNVIWQLELSAPSSMVGYVVCSTQQNGQSVPDRIFGIVFLGHCVVPVQPLILGKTCKLRE